LVVEERVKPGELKAGFKNQQPSFLGLGLQKSGQVSKSQQNFCFLLDDSSQTGWQFLGQFKK